MARIRRGQLAIKKEATSGTAETLVAADVIGPVTNITWTANVDVNERNVSSTSIGSFGKVAGKRSGTLAFDIEVKGSGTGIGQGQVSPSWAKLLEFAGMAPTTGIANVTYAFNSGLKNTCTALFQSDQSAADCTNIQLVGAVVGSLSFNFTAGGIVTASVTLIGAQTAPSDSSFLNPTYQDTVPPAFLSAAFKYKTNAAVISTIGIDFGINAAGVESVNAVNGYDRFEIVGRNVVGSIDPEQQSVATFNWFNQITGDLTGAFTCQVGSASGNTVVFTGSNVQLDSISTVDRGGVAGYSIPLRFAHGTGDNDIRVITS